MLSLSKSRVERRDTGFVLLLRTQGFPRRYRGSSEKETTKWLWLDFLPIGRLVRWFVPFAIQCRAVWVPHCSSLLTKYVQNKPKIILNFEPSECKPIDLISIKFDVPPYLSFLTKWIPSTFFSSAISVRVLVRSSFLSLFLRYPSEPNFGDGCL